MRITERITIFRKSQNIGQTAFEITIGAARGYLSNVKTIGSDKIQNIADKFPILSIDWLITGKGEMLKTETPSITTPSAPETSIETATTEQLKTMLYSMQKQIIELQSKIIELQNTKLTESTSSSRERIDKKLSEIEKQVGSIGKGTPRRKQSTGRGGVKSA